LTPATTQHAQSSLPPTSSHPPLRGARPHLGSFAVLLFFLIPCLALCPFLNVIQQRNPLYCNPSSRHPSTRLRLTHLSNAYLSSLSFFLFPPLPTSIYARAWMLRATVRWLFLSFSLSLPRSHSRFRHAWRRRCERHGSKETMKTPSRALFLWGGFCLSSAWYSFLPFFPYSFSFSLFLALLPCWISRLRHLLPIHRARGISSASQVCRACLALYTIVLPFLSLLFFSATSGHVGIFGGVR